MNAIVFLARGLLALCIALGATTQVRAQIVVGQTAGFTGQVADAV
jgi:hypothetical protein